MKLLLSYILIVMAFCGCSGNQALTNFDVSTVNSEKDSAVVLFYRPNQMLFIDDFFTIDAPQFQEDLRVNFYSFIEKETTPVVIEDKWAIVIDDVPDIRLGENEFFVKNIKPGQHKFNARSDRFDIVSEFNLQGGGVYFFSVYGESHDWWENIKLNSGPYVRISEQSKEHASEQIVHMKQVIEN